MHESNFAKSFSEIISFFTVISHEFENSFPSQTQICKFSFQSSLRLNANIVCENIFDEIRAVNIVIIQMRKLSPILGSNPRLIGWTPL